MAWSQLSGPYWDAVDNAGFCLSFTQRAFVGNGNRTPVLHYCARDAWDASPTKHWDRNMPNDVAVPVWWSWTGSINGEYRDWGHAAVYYNGRIFTSPGRGHGSEWFDSIEALERAWNIGLQFLGWTEDIGGLSVISSDGGYVPSTPANSGAYTGGNTYTVVSGDSYWAIAEKITGSSDVGTVNNKKNELIALNGGAALYAGNTIIVSASAPAAAPSTPAEVQSGEGYWHVAKRVWGGDDATVEANMNKLIDINGGVRLYAGMILQTEYPAAPAVDNSAAEAAAKAAAEAEAAAKAVAEAEAASKLAQEAAVKAEADAKAAAEKAAKDEETRKALLETVKKEEADKAKDAMAEAVETVTETINNTIENIAEGVNNIMTEKYQGPVLTAEQYNAIQTQVATADAAGIEEVKNYNLISKEFWNYAGERVIKTFAMATAGQLSVTAAYVVTSPDSAVVFADLGWTYIVSVAGVSALTSLLTALANFKDIVTLKKDNKL